jgi:hypothetical protein
MAMKHCGNTFQHMGRLCGKLSSARMPSTFYFDLSLWFDLTFGLHALCLSFYKFEEGNQWFQKNQTLRTFSIQASNAKPAANAGNVCFIPYHDECGL